MINACLALALADSGEIDLDIGEPDLGETDEPMDTDIPVLSHPGHANLSY